MSQVVQAQIKRCLTLSPFFLHYIFLPSDPKSLGFLFLLFHSLPKFSLTSPLLFPSRIEHNGEHRVVFNKSPARTYTLSPQIASSTASLTFPLRCPVGTSNLTQPNRTLDFLHIPKTVLHSAILIWGNGTIIHPVRNWVYSYIHCPSPSHPPVLLARSPKCITLLTISPYCQCNHPSSSYNQLLPGLPESRQFHYWVQNRPKLITRGCFPKDTTDLQHQYCFPWDTFKIILNQGEFTANYKSRSTVSWIFSMQDKV